MPTLQDFSIPADNDAVVTVTVIDPPGLSLAGTTIEWRAYQQLHGVTISTVALAKSSSSHGGGIAIPGSPADVFTIAFAAADTAALLGNYYHEATVIDAIGERSTVMYGLMTVLQTENP